MAKQKRKQAPAEPISKHQLFPAVVALWFGALFGLGSLAVRPALIESLVISSRIDLIVPAAAPPLGITARILVALIMAAIGSGIGIAIARRLARPKPEHQKHKRGTGAVTEESGRLRGGNHHADTAVRQPLSIGEDLRSDAGARTPARRRRSLTIEHVEADFVAHDLAPLPGSVPQILDIGEVRLSPEAAEAPLDLSDYAAQMPEQLPPAASSPVQLDWNNAAPVQSAPGIEPQAPRQVFQPLETPPAPDAFTTHHHDIAQEAAAAAADGRQVFGMAAQPAPAESPRQVFGQPVADDPIDPEIVKLAESKTLVFAMEAPTPLFPPREGAASPEGEPADYTVPPAPEVHAYQVPEVDIPPSQFVTAAAAPEQPTAPAPVNSEPAPALPSAANLGLDDLAARLAESMARHRAARSNLPIETLDAAAPAPIPAPLEAAVAAPVEPAQPLEPAALAIPQPYVPPISAEPLAPISPPFAQSFAAPAPIADGAVVAEAEPAPQPDLAPQAMRPLDLDGFEQGHDPLDSVLPPRTLAMPAVLAQPPAPIDPALVAEPADEAEIANEDVAEADYGSLLGVVAAGSARSGFVRIEEPEAENAATEPVVIFPGQMTRPITQVSSNDAGSFRRFDSPASAEQGQPIAANQALSEVDSEEAQRALRSALANLQRMSGAA